MLLYDPKSLELRIGDLVFTGEDLAMLREAARDLVVHHVRVIRVAWSQSEREVQRTPRLYGHLRLVK